MGLKQKQSVSVLTHQQEKNCQVNNDSILAMAYIHMQYNPLPASSVQTDIAEL